MLRSVAPLRMGRMTHCVSARAASSVLRGVARVSTLRPEGSLAHAGSEDIARPACDRARCRDRCSASRASHAPARRADSDGRGVGQRARSRLHPGRKGRHSIRKAFGGLRAPRDCGQAAEAESARSAPYARDVGASRRGASQGRLRATRPCVRRLHPRRNTRTRSQTCKRQPPG